MLFLMPLGANPIETGGMTVSWEHREDGIEFSLTAPTTGWVAVGFNDSDDIVGADLVMARVESGQSEARHFYVVRAGDPRPVESLGESSIVRNVDGRISDGVVEVHVRLDPALGPGRSFDLSPGTNLYLIVAYSVSQDFDHHSRMRRHVEVEL